MIKRNALAATAALALVAPTLAFAQSTTDPSITSRLSEAQQEALEQTARQNLRLSATKDKMTGVLTGTEETPFGSLSAVTRAKVRNNRVRTDDGVPLLTGSCTIGDNTDQRGDCVITVTFRGTARSPRTAIGFRTFKRTIKAGQTFTAKALTTKASRNKLKGKTSLTVVSTTTVRTPAGRLVSTRKKTARLTLTK